MSWWHQPFTLIYVPHDGSHSRTLTIKRLTFVCLLFLGAFFVSTGVLMSLSGLGGTSNNHEARASASTDRARQTSRAEGVPKSSDVKQTISALRTQLQKTRRKHQAILRIAGIQPGQPSSNESKDLKEWFSNSDKVLESSIERNQQLKQIKKFVQSRNKVFRHTPTLWPTEGWLSSPYGYRKDPMGGKGKSFHDGVDIAAWHGTPVRATAEGKVVFSGRKSGYGQVIKVRHEYGYMTLYGHLSERLVSEGERVTKGKAVGRVGNTGHSTGSHVHYEVRVNDNDINPWPYLVEQFESYKQYAMKGESE